MNENSQPKAPAINAWIDQATRALKQAGIATARLDAEVILAHTLRQPRTYLHAHGEELLSRRNQEIADARLALREDRVPVAYIIGHKEFYGRRFAVTTATLIPRPESETLIDVLKWIVPDTVRLIPDHAPRLVDVGTGSGILGITAKLELPELEVTLTDISRHALTIAERNAKMLHADVDLLMSDLLANYPFEADIIVANLPYVDPEWERSPETNHEPELALFAANHGLALMFRLLAQTPSHLVKNGYLLLEADPEQHDALIKEAKKYGLTAVQSDAYALLLKRKA